MATDAILTQLGPGRVTRWAFNSDMEYRNACEAESEFIQSIETELSRQLDCKVKLPSSLYLEQEIGDNDEEESYAMVVGGSEGLSWLQESIQEFFVDGNACLAEQFQHILNHSLVSGIYIPVDFPRPFVLQLRRDTVSVGSLFQLRRELAVWLEKIFQNHSHVDIKVKEIMKEYAANLNLVINAAEKEGKAIELI